MKNLLLMLTLVLIISSCEKKEVENSCPVIAGKDLPVAVLESFSIKYPNTDVTTWFNKDNKGFSALITLNGVKKLVEFDTAGNFITEQTGKHQHGEHHDEGCECETENE